MSFKFVEITLLFKLSTFLETSTYFRINQTAEAVRRSCDFLATETPNSQLHVYKERAQLVRDALSRFMDNFYSYVAALMTKMVSYIMFLKTPSKDCSNK